MKSLLATAVLMGSIPGAAGAATPVLASAPPILLASDARALDAAAAASERQADFYATLAKEYAAAGKPALTGQARHFGLLRDRYLKLAADRRDQAARARGGPSPREST